MEGLTNEAESTNGECWKAAVLVHSAAIIPFGVVFIICVCFEFSQFLR